MKSILKMDARKFCCVEFCNVFPYLYSRFFASIEAQNYTYIIRNSLIKLSLPTCCTPKLYAQTQQDIGRCPGYLHLFATLAKGAVCNVSKSFRSNIFHSFWGWNYPEMPPKCYECSFESDFRDFGPFNHENIGSIRFWFMTDLPPRPLPPLLQGIDLWGFQPAPMPLRVRP